MENLRSLVKSSNFNWGPVLFIAGYHLLILLLLPVYLMFFNPSWGILTASFVMLYLTGLSVTAGYHRLYSHTTYKANSILEYVLLFFGTMATQGSVIRWSFDHRYHHAFVDTERDPYSIKKGFWYAHFGWILEKPKPIEDKVVSDLLRKPVLRFQHRYYSSLMFLTNAMSTVFIGWCCSDYFGAFVFVWLVRLFFLHHFTWFINSLAHTWGARTFCQELSAVDNFLISLVTFGEGYHNYHHAFSYDYRNGVRWYHFDPAKWLIWTLSKIGLAYKLKKNHRYFIEEQLLLDKKKLLLSKIQTSFDAHKEIQKEKITKLSESVLAKLAHLKKLVENYQTLKKEKKVEKERLKVMHSEIKQAKKSLKEEYVHWAFLSRHLLADSSHNDMQGMAS